MDDRSPQDREHEALWRREPVAGDLEPPAARGAGAAIPPPWEEDPAATWTPASALEPAGPGSAGARSAGGAAPPRLASRAVGGACPFGLCPGDGFVVDEATNTAHDCRCRPGRLAAARARKLEARIPKRYREISFDRLDGTDLVAYPEQVEVVRRFTLRVNERLDAGRGLWLMGDVGTGKTTLAMLVSKAAIAAGRSVAIYSMPRLLGKIREAIADEDGVVGFLDRLCAVDLLHLDDVGSENRTDWTLEQLYSIVNTRYEEERSIVLTTNLEPRELGDQIGERIVSRLVEMCGDPLPLFGSDRRRDFAVGEH